MGTFDYILYLRSMGYKSSHISNMIDEGAASCPIKRPSILDINLSSLIIPSLKDTVNVRRTVTNIGPEKSKYEAIIEPPPGITIKQERDRLLAKVENRAANTDGKVIKLQYTHSQKQKNLDAQEIKCQGSTKDRLVLLKGVSGYFWPVALIVLMGVSGAGKTTLMDVLDGRKIGGYVNGDIKISGYPKKQETFVRITATTM
ncbi:hypothetical protein T459_27523 [Capsicum annuum]|uniref:Subtilisin-like protease fibronectin type-III domain-containing protein n=1 Tax=Capsicum annuum TaxID=4072 RepID=A0A2G2YE75_CAPAN|nr:hypothetical protein T459_27523 [Capsicum annuum]